MQYVKNAALPEGHRWAIVERGEEVTAYVIDGAAEKVARAVWLLQLEKVTDARQ